MVYSKGQVVPGSDYAGGGNAPPEILNIFSYDGSGVHTYTLPVGLAQEGDLILGFGGGAYAPSSASAGMNSLVTVPDGSTSMQCGLYAQFCGAAPPTSVSITFSSSNSSNMTSFLLIRNVKGVGDAKGQTNGGTSSMAGITFGSPFFWKRSPLSIMFLHSTTHSNFTVVPTPLTSLFSSASASGGRFQRGYTIAPPADMNYSATPIASSNHKCGIVVHLA